MTEDPQLNWLDRLKATLADMWDRNSCLACGRRCWESNVNRGCAWAKLRVVIDRRGTSRPRPRNLGWGAISVRVRVRSYPRSILCLELGSFNSFNASSSPAEAVCRAAPTSKFNLKHSPCLVEGNFLTIIERMSGRLLYSSYPPLNPASLLVRS